MLKEDKDTTDNNLSQCVYQFQKKKKNSPDKIMFGDNTERMEMASVADPVIQANWRPAFEDDLRSGGLLCVTTW